MSGLRLLEQTDPPAIDKILSTVKGDIAFDIGANIGQTARKLADRFRKVLAVEPAQESYDHLTRHVPDNVICRHIGAGRNFGRLRLEVRPGAMELGMVTMYGADRFGTGELIDTREVNVEPLDVMAIKCGWPDFVKIDVEGAEIEVMLGARRVFGRTPRFVIEVHDDAHGRVISAMLDPLYDTIEQHRHPSYKTHEWEYVNHYWLVSL